MNGIPRPEDALLDADEQEYEDHFEEFVPAPETERAALIAAARNEPRSIPSGRRPLSVRIENADIEALKVLAEREGLPYQTLLGSIVHKYVTGILVDVNEARKVLARN
jgi:predicted DNA binding CopG/RHH family protein